MIPFWSSIICPMLLALRPDVIVEVGAAGGANTRNLLTLASREDAVVHVIDPAPQFDVAAYSREFGSHMILHRAKSLEVLADITGPDVILIDGDHNWYTVHSELQLIERRACSDDRNVPLVLLHDVSWPYAHRDLYYNPDDIPAEFRHDWARKPIFPGQSDLDEVRGVNGALANGLKEGGPRNGVLTAIEDYLAATTIPLESRFVPGFAGLGVLAPKRLLCENDDFRRVWNKLVDPDFLKAHMLRMETSLARSRAMHATVSRELGRKDKDLQRANARLDELDPRRSK